MNPSPFAGVKGESGQCSAYPTRDELKKSRERYQDLIDSGSELSAVYACDAAGVITYYNKRAAALWGREPATGDTDERFCGSNMLYRADGRYMHYIHYPMADVLAGRLSGVHDAEMQIQRPDGTRVVVIVNIAPLIDDDKFIVGAVTSFREKPLQRRDG